MQADDIDTLRTCHLCNDSDSKMTGHVASNKSVHLDIYVKFTVMGKGGESRCLGMASMSHR